MIVQLRLRDLAALYGLLQLLAIKQIQRLLLIEPRVRRLHRAVRRIPVRDNEARKLPLALDEIVQQPVVLAAIRPVDAVVAAHDHVRMAGLDADLERQQVALASRAFANQRVHFLPSALLIVERIVLDIGDHILRALAANALAHHRSGEHGVLAHVLKRAAVARFACDVRSAAQRRVVALHAQLVANQLAVRARRIGVPARRRSKVRRQRSRVAAIVGALPHAVGCVRHLDRGNPQPRHTKHKPCAAIRLVLHGLNLRRQMLLPRHAIAVQHADLLIERHLLEHEVRAALRRELRVHPRAILVPSLRLSRHRQSRQAKHPQHGRPKGNLNHAFSLLCI